MVESSELWRELERTHEERAAQCVATTLLPGAEVVRRESPDFELRRSVNEAIGLEVTTTVAHPLRHSRNVRNHVAAVLQELLNASGTVGTFWVGFDLDSLASASKGGVGRWKRAVPGLLARVIDDAAADFIPREVLQARGIYHIASVHIVSPRRPGEALVGQSMHRDGPMNPFAQRLAAKTEKLAGYRSRPDTGHLSEYWLAIAAWPSMDVLDGFAMCTDRYFSFTPGPQTYDRVLLLPLNDSAEYEDVVDARSQRAPMR